MDVKFNSILFDNILQSEDRFSKLNSSQREKEEHVLQIYSEIELIPVVFPVDHTMQYLLLLIRQSWSDILYGMNQVPSARFPRLYSVQLDTREAAFPESSLEVFSDGLSIIGQ